MTLSANVDALAARVGEEIKAVRAAAASAGLLWSAEVDFGADADPVAAYTVSVPGVPAGADILAGVSSRAPVGEQADEQEWEPVSCSARVLAAGSVEVLCWTQSGAPLTGKRVVTFACGTASPGSSVMRTPPNSLTQGGSGLTLSTFPNTVILESRMGNNDLWLNDGRLRAYPLLLDYPIIVTALAVASVRTAGVAGTVIRTGFVPANEDWTPAATGVINLATVAGDTTGYKILTGLSVELAAGRWLRLIRGEGGTPVCGSLRTATVGAQAYLDAYNYGINNYANFYTGVGAFADPIPTFSHTWQESGSVRGDMLDPMLARWEPA